MKRLPALFSCNGDNDHATRSPRPANHDRPNLGRNEQHAENPLLYLLLIEIAIKASGAEVVQCDRVNFPVAIQLAQFSTVSPGTAAKSLSPLMTVQLPRLRPCVP